jgi:hypothetical protein
MRKYLGLLNHASFSQDLNMLKNTPFIFKGTVTTLKAFKIKDDKTLYASYIINITAIYKGENELKLGTIEMIMKAPSLWRIAIGVDGSESLTFYDDADAYYEENKYPMNLSDGMTCVFFCNKNTIFSSHVKSDDIKIITTSNSYVGKITDVKFDNTVILEPICNTMNCLFYYYNGVRRIENSNRTEGFLRIKGFGKEFNSEEELMEYLKNENIISQNDNNKNTEKTEEPPLKQTQAQKAEADSLKQVQNKLLYEKRKKNYDQYMEQNMKIMNAQKINVDSTKQKKPH